jgi:flavodoxin
MKRVLVVYYSRSGYTEFVAKRIAAACHADLERIEDPRKREGVFQYLRSALEALLGWRPAIAPGRRRPANYDLVIIGTPVWFWNVASPVRTWLQRHHTALSQVAVFCTFGGSGHAKVLDDLEGLCGHRALARLALTEGAVDQYQLHPPLHTFLLELKRWQPPPAPLPQPERQATA